MKFALGLSSTEAILAVVCALAGVIGFLAAVAQIWEFVENRPGLRRLLFGLFRGFATLTTLAILAVGVLHLAANSTNTPVTPPAKGADAPAKQTIVSATEDKVEGSTKDAPHRTPTRWIVIVPNQIAKERFKKISEAASRWSRTIEDDDLVTMMSFSNKGVVVSLENRRGEQARKDLPESVDNLWTVRGGSLDEAVLKAYKLLGPPDPGRKGLVVVLSDTDPRGFVEAPRPSIAGTDRPEAQDGTSRPAVAGVGE